MGYKKGSGLGRNEDGMLESLGATAKNWSHQEGLRSGNAPSVHRAKRRQTDSVSDPRNQSRPRTADIAVSSALPDFEQLRTQSEMRVSNVRALVCDMNALLQNAEVLSCAAWDTTLVEQLGLSQHTVQEYPAYRLLPAGLSDKDCLLHLLAAHHVSFHWSRLEQLLEAFDENYIKQRAAIRLRPGVRPLLTALQAAGWRYGVVQKGSRRRLKFELRQTGLEADFIVQVSLANLAEAHQQRPYSEIYTEARLRMQVPAYHTAILETSPIVLENLAKLGLVGVQIPAEIDCSHIALADAEFPTPDAIDKLLREGCAQKSVGTKLSQMCVGSTVLVQSNIEELWCEATVDAINNIEGRESNLSVRLANSACGKHLTVPEHKVYTIHS